MKTMKNLILVLAAIGLAGVPAFAQQNTLTATTLSAAVTVNARSIALTSATGVTAPTSSVAGSQIWIQDVGQSYGELDTVLSVSGTTVYVQRTAGQATAHASGAMVLIGNANWFYKFNPTGSCTTASTLVSPWLNTNTGEQWLCSTVTKTWVPSFGNRMAANQVTTAVASVAGATAAASPLFHVTGTNAITSWTMGAGWAGQGFCVIPDGIFTTTATNNIALASTAVVNKTLCFTWDATNSKFTPSY